MAALLKRHFAIRAQITGEAARSASLIKGAGGCVSATRGKFLASRRHPNDVPSDSGADAWRRASLPCGRRVPSTRKYMSRRDHRPPFVVSAGAKIKRVRRRARLAFVERETRRIRERRRIPASRIGASRRRETIYISFTLIGDY